MQRRWFRKEHTCIRFIYTESIDWLILKTYVSVLNICVTPFKTEEIGDFNVYQWYSQWKQNEIAIGK